MAELGAVRQKMATGPMQAAENEKQKIIFKWALKINCLLRWGSTAGWLNLYLLSRLTGV